MTGGTHPRTGYGVPQTAEDAADAGQHTGTIRQGNRSQAEVRSVLLGRGNTGCWDAGMLGCDAVYSEDMSHQVDYDGLRVVDPFSD